MSRFSRLIAIWAGAAAIAGSWIILEILNDSSIIEEILNFDLYRPGWDEFLASWIYALLSLGMTILAFLVWKKKEGKIEIRILYTGIAVSSIWLIIILLKIRLFALIP